MKKSVLILILILLPLITFGKDFKNNPFVEELVPKVKSKTTLKVYKVKRDNAKFAHPQTLNKKQVNKIFHCIRIKGKVPVLVLNSKQIRKITDKFIKLMSNAAKNEIVVVERNKNYIDQKSKKNLLTRVDKICFWFKDKDNLVVSYDYRGYDAARILETGYHVDYLKENGKTYKSAIVIKRDMWTTKINKSPFEKDYENTWENVEKNLTKEKGTKGRKQVKNKSEKKQQTISIEEMQKELQRLKDMLDKKLITEEEYNMLKKNVLKKAGL